MNYDSTKDTMSHIYNIQWVWTNLVRPQLDERFDKHDQSKLENPEKACYDKYIPMLQETKYGTPEYYEIKDKMAKEGLQHHYAVNNHYPRELMEIIHNTSSEVFKGQKPTDNPYK